LAPEKGVETLIRAAIRSSSNLMIVGSGPIENELKAIASGSSIEFLGFKSGDDLWNLVRQSRAVVLPSEWYENCPMSVLESYALGKPVIGANIGGIPEIIQSGVTGWIFESGNEAELSELLHVVTEESDSILEEMGRAARNYVAKEFAPEKYMSSTKNLYSSIGVSF
jgi:glycosyltransferase involved in cell wall biosynthesis